jgi:CheY-like chemotaxis protein
MNESTDSIGGGVVRTLRTVQLIGFSTRDRELLRLFLRRPPGAGVSLSVVENHEDCDLLICNAASTPESIEHLRARGASRPSIGIVSRFERTAQFYQVTQDSQLLFSLAQAINRIREGWTPPPALLATEADVAQPSADRAVDIDLYATVPTVPAATASAAMAEPGTAASIAITAGLPWQRALTVLVIDDSHFSREAVSSALIKVGFHVSTADGGEEGLRLAAAHRFDVALVDFEMPVMRGPEVLRKLRALGTKSPSVLMMLTSRSGAVDRLRAKFAGCDAYLTKPTRMREFLETLRELAAAGKLNRT